MPNFVNIQLFYHQINFGLRKKKKKKKKVFFAEYSFLVKKKKGKNKNKNELRETKFAFYNLYLFCQI